MLAQQASQAAEQRAQAAGQEQRPQPSPSSIVLLRGGEAKGHQGGKHRHHATQAGCYDRQRVDLQHWAAGVRYVSEEPACHQRCKTCHLLAIRCGGCDPQQQCVFDNVFPTPQCQLSIFLTPLPCAQQLQACLARPLRPTPVQHPPTRFTLAARLPGPPERQRGKRWVQAPTTAQAAPAMPNVLWDGCREAGKGTHGQLGQQVAK